MAGQPWTQYSARNLAALDQELEEVRQRGYSIDNGQLREAMVCYGAPVFSAGCGHAIAGIAIGLLSVDVTKSSEATMSGAVRELAARLAHRLGGASRLSRA
jgi:DNA-binding IclR family transcriptional regulator